MKKSKLCTTCKVEKPVTEFYNKAATLDGLAPQCKACVCITNAAWVKANPEKVAANGKKWRKAHPRTATAAAAAKLKWRLENPSKSITQNATRVARWNKAHPGRAKLIVAAWKKANAARVNALCAARKARRLQATPAWANSFFIEEIYDLAQRRTKALGFEWQVDHIVPLRSAVVCGLHTEQNLQVIPGTDNVKKGNRYWPDMPEVAHG